MATYRFRTLDNILILQKHVVTLKILQTITACVGCRLQMLPFMPLQGVTAPKRLASTLAEKSLGSVG